ncbi:Peptidase C48, SUMO/Sentrin/Ubl1 [Corchorus olitorius]|uniref:Peptidase C48, SUMO/Sentrin/Ubl1 n=1 Tax=Corchorus olitorius TaxID=93759 RepID=A0A1R3KJD2_9ROSI|nr:Peptidase C48, SUMO/Sentrin/Ubl1 [Corchorus olitorius]
MAGQPDCLKKATEKDEEGVDHVVSDQVILSSGEGCENGKKSEDATCNHQYTMEDDDVIPSPKEKGGDRDGLEWLKIEFAETKMKVDNCYDVLKILMEDVNIIKKHILTENKCNECGRNKNNVEEANDPMENDGKRNGDDRMPRTYPDHGVGHEFKESGVHKDDEFSQLVGNNVNHVHDRFGTFESTPVKNDSTRNQRTRGQTKNRASKKASPKYYGGRQTFSSNIEEDKCLLSEEDGFSSPRDPLKVVFSHPCRRRTGRKVIDLVVYHCNVEARKRWGSLRKWFLPQFFQSRYKFFRAHRTSMLTLRSEVISNMLTPGIYMSTLDECDEARLSIVVPMNEDNYHWYAMVIDIKGRFIKILDSLPSHGHNEIRHQDAKDLVQFCSVLFEDERFGDGRWKVNGINYWPIIRPDGVPIQQGVECGMYVMKFLLSRLVGDLAYKNVTCNGEDDRFFLAGFVTNSHLNKYREMMLAALGIIDPMQNGEGNDSRHN